MKVLIINGSPHKDGNTKKALEIVEKELNHEGIDTVTVSIGTSVIRGCIACNFCKENHKCAFDDLVNETSVIFKECDGILIGTPVYYSGMNGSLKAFLDRLFNSSYIGKTMKVGAAVSTLRRTGSTSALSDIYKYFEISGMPIATSSYFNEIYDSEDDTEGIQTMKNLGRNMAFLIKSIKLGKEKYEMPYKVTGFKTNFYNK